MRREPPISQLVEDLGRDTRAYLEAEVARLRVEARTKTRQVARSIVIGVTVAVFAGVGLSSLSTGMIAALTPLLGSVGAPIVVGAGLLTVAVALSFVLRPARRLPVPRPTAPELSDGTQ